MSAPAKPRPRRDEQAESPSDRLPPHNRDAERSVLGSMIRDNLCIADALQDVKPEQFYFNAHQQIFNAACKLYGKHKPVDLVTLAEELRAQKAIEDIGGYPYLAELWDAAPTAANFRHYLAIVKTKAILRSLIHAGNEILRDAYEPAEDATDILAKAEQAVLAIGQTGTETTSVTLEAAMQSAFNAVDDAAQGRGAGIPTGLHALDAKLGGLRAGELVIVAARPGHGKTSIGLSIADHVTREEKIPTLFVSLEMNKAELATRLLSMYSGIPHFKLRKGDVNAADMDLLIRAGDAMGKAHFHIDDWPGQTATRIAANVRRLKHRQKLGLVIIDYLQLIEPEAGRQPRHEQVQLLSRRMKLLARELQIPVVVLAQLNREAESSTDHKPKVWQLRESGSLEQDADAVILLHRPELYDEFKTDEKMHNIAEVIIGKQRNGPTGTVVMGYRKELMKFENRECDYYQ